MIKANEIDGATKMIKVIKIEKAGEAIEIKAKIKKNVNSGIRISITILTMRKLFAKHALI